MDTKGFKKRFEALNNIEELLSVAAPQYRDPKVYFRELIENEPSEALAEKRLRLLENLRAETKEDETKLVLDRILRESLEFLRDTDWTQLPDVPLSAEVKKYYRKYRSYLRDLPELVTLSKVSTEVMTYVEWSKWIEKVRHRPGFEEFIP